jgi:hypothetical protein
MKLTTLSSSLSAPILSSACRERKALLRPARLFNCFTETMKGLSIFNLAPRTQALHGLLDQFTGVSDLFSKN